MELMIFETPAAVADEGARRIRHLLHARPDAVLGLATGSTPLTMYERLVRDCRQKRISFAAVTTFNLDEYVGLDGDHPQSYRHYMNEHFFSKIDIDLANTHLPVAAAGANPLRIGAEYETKIAAAGGIDLQVLGIGRNGHIGFNEPTSSLGSRTRVKTLTRETLASNRRFFPAHGKQAELAITMGIATIMEARKVLLLATGEEKAAAVEQLIEGPVSAMWPATTLQYHGNVTVLLDAAAASRLKNRDYYDWVQQQQQKLVQQFDAD
ncbi:MAG TPA: glucosamine-6-phosphate deaminase [Woeseiaceae bacterium]|nr:glucosamine-6-phosphate deaminase [Woeseiaceae bacterium]